MTRIFDVENAFDHYLRVGSNSHGSGVYVRVQFKDGKLSITGSDGPRSGGQINMGVKPEDIRPADGWTQEMIASLWAMWDKWHLNDMRAGSPAQRAHLATLTFPGYPLSHYEWACDELRKVNLHPDGSYLYGSAWLREDVPELVIEWLKELPTVDTVPAWAR